MEIKRGGSSEHQYLTCYAPCPATSPKPPPPPPCRPRGTAAGPSGREPWLPYRRFAVILAEDCARIGGDVGCYSFIAVDSHHILLAGLPAHSLALRPARSPGHQFVTRYPKASAITSPPCLLRLLPAGAVAGRGLHPLESAALSRRTWKTGA